MLKLFDYFRSSASFRVRIALNLKGLNFEAIPIHLLNNGGEQNSQDFQHINPQGLVPVLQDGEMLITQSLAIIEYLDDLHPLPAFLPKDSYQKALVKAFALAIAADIHPINNLRVIQYLISEFNMSEEQKIKWHRYWISKGLIALEQQMVQHNYGQDFCFGNEPSLADICLVPQLFNARRFACDLTPYPTLMRIDANCQSHQAFKKAWPVDNTVSA